ncbi:phosphatidylinositol-3,5-bisphosphate 5-phosphatase [Pseudogymnoascus australis]
MTGAFDDTGEEARGRSPGQQGRQDPTGQLQDETWNCAQPTDDTFQAASAMHPLPASASNDFVAEGSPTEPVLSPLHSNLPKHVEDASQPSSAKLTQGNGLYDKPAISGSSQSFPGPSLDQKRGKGALHGKTGDQGVCKMHKFTVYETATRYYIVGADIMDQRFRILKIDRNSDVGNLSVSEDDIVYTKKEMNELLSAIGDGNKGTGGMKLKCSTWGLLGFVRFTGTYYMLLITKRSQVAMIGGHYVYQIDGTELVPLVTSQNSRFKPDSRNAEETRFLGILNNLDLSRSFYFSYSYDITHTLQHNILKERDAMAQNLPRPYPPEYNDMFVWNNYLLRPATVALKNTYDWCLPIIHGYMDQAALSIYGRTVYITIIARRSRFFAGARFLKRGANDLGYVANDVETEQIVAEGLTTSFHAPGPKLFASPNYTSYVQHRGSIPLYWTQDSTGVTPKPPIELNLVDPFYSAAALHFDNLFQRYGAPIYVLNLVKSRERIPRESKLLHEFTTAINYLNQSLPEGKKIIHKAWDMSRASKSRDQDVIGTLEAIAEEVVTTTGLFRNGDGKATLPTVQNGVARTNCIDCLDRTNAAQFVIGKRALGYQLHALGIIAGTSIDYDTDAVNLFTHMYHDHGDTIAVQYGGSQLVNTMETYRKINQWTSHSRDMVESFKRYYNNSFLDGQRQEAYNLFLGNYIFTQGQPMLWDLVTDYYLHHADPRAWSGKQRRNYISWYTPEYLAERKMPTDALLLTSRTTDETLYDFDDYWLEYYKPLALSSFLKIFSYNMNSTVRYTPARSIQEGRYDLSPFRVRTEINQAVPDKRAAINQAANLDTRDKHDDDTSVSPGTRKRTPMQRWLQPIDEKASMNHGTMMEPWSTKIHLSQPSQKIPALDLSKTAPLTFKQVVQDSLNPFVTDQEAEDYARYINHPQTLPLVVSTETPADIDVEYLDYVSGAWQESNSLSYTLEEDLRDFSDFLTVPDNPLTVTNEDAQKKRYKAYRKWHNGKSLFKQQPID